VLLTEINLNIGGLFSDITVGDLYENRGRTLKYEFGQHISI
jgi:hypothetical protein